MRIEVSYPVLALLRDLQISECIADRDLPPARRKRGTLLLNHPESDIRASRSRRFPGILQTTPTSCAGSQCRPIGRSSPRREAGLDNPPCWYAARPPVPENACARCLPRFLAYRCGPSSLSRNARGQRLLIA